MLILKRYTEQSILIGDDITVTVKGVDTRTGNVTLGIDAPKSVPVHRDDIVNKKPKNKHAEGTPEYYREEQRQTISLNKEI